MYILSHISSLTRSYSWYYNNMSMKIFVATWVTLLKKKGKQYSLPYHFILSMMSYWYMHKVYALNQDDDLLLENFLASWNGSYCDMWCIEYSYNSFLMILAIMTCLKWMIPNVLKTGLLYLGFKKGKSIICNIK